MRNGNRMRGILAATTTVLFIPVSSWAVEDVPAADSAPADAPAEEVGTAIQEVLVTATKKGRAEAAQDVPLAITAFTGEQLQARQTRDLAGLTVSMPNVSLDSIGTQKATANFAIRGLGTNSSIPSIEPTVGVFVDGMYLGINTGVIYDVFDLEGIEVLRGPQGLLFGRNVTGGAIVVKTRKPSDTLDASLKASVTDDMDKIIAGSVSGPLVEGKLKARLTGYYDDDDGWFTNQFDGEDFGASETKLLRPSVTWTPTENTDLTLRYEHGEFDGTGSASQNRADFDRHSHEFSINEEGYDTSEWNQAIAELNVGVPFGDGTITNIFGWRELDQDVLTDIDATPLTFFHARFLVDQEQMSDELRFAGEFGDRVSLTAGLYWFTQEIKYFETRNVFSPLAMGVVTGTLGGIQDSTTYGVFTSADIALSDAWTLTLGARYTQEEKQAYVATFGVGPASPCDLTAKNCNFDFPSAIDPDAGEEKWSDVTPKVGLQYQLTDDAQIYGFWTTGFRSGGYNLRSTVPAAENPPGPFDPEEQNSFELGTKADWLDGRLRTNVALFYNQIDDLQREVNLPSGAGAGVVQLIRNTADATIMGGELELEALVTDNFLVTAQVGYVDGEYDEVRYDISGDNVIDDTDLALDIPRLAPLTYGVGFSWDLSLGELGTLTPRVNFNHRDRSAYTDNNRGTLNTVDMLDASISLLMLDDRLSIAVFGKNLTDRVIEGNDTQLPVPFQQAPLGTRNPTYSPLTKGRAVGLEVNYRM
jgi:iron complex outermembrane receptor protein